MNLYLKHGVSAIALLTAISIAHAQTAERQGGEKGGPAQQMQSEHGGKEGGAMQHEGRATERGGKESQSMQREGNSAERQRGTAGERSAKEEGRKGEARAEGERGKIENRGERTGRENKQLENRAQSEQVAKGQRSAKNAPSEEQREETQREGERKEQGKEMRQRESQAGTAGKSEELRREGERGEHRANINIDTRKKTELHQFVESDRAIHRLHRGDVHFDVRVGARIPDGVEYYAPPPRFVELVPEFRRYKIIVLDDEILVIDPATREIVDVIPV